MKQLRSSPRMSINTRQRSTRSDTCSRALPAACTWFRPMSDFDLIVADIDGTLINDEKRLSALTIATIRRVRRDFGVDVLLASSRMPQSIRQIQIQLGCLDAIVALDGALVVD